MMMSAKIPLEGSLAVKVVINNNCISPRFLGRIGVAEEYCKVTRGTMMNSLAKFCLFPDRAPK